MLLLLSDASLVNVPMTDARWKKVGWTIIAPSIAGVARSGWYTFARKVEEPSLSEGNAVSAYVMYILDEHHQDVFVKPVA